MATLPPGTPVTLLASYEAALAFPPPAGSELYVALHPGALQAGTRNLLTQIIALADQRVAWVGALDEQMLERRDAPEARDARALLVWLLGRGAFGQIIWPGELALHPGEDLYTVYQKSRPWVVVGELEDGSPIAAPLNDASRPLWFTPVIEANEVLMETTKRAQLELAHLWSFPPGQKAVGSINQSARERISEVMTTYFGLQ